MHCEHLSGTGAPVTRRLSHEAEQTMSAFDAMSQNERGPMRQPTGVLRQASSDCPMDALSWRRHSSTLGAPRSNAPTQVANPWTVFSMFLTQLARSLSP